MDMERYNEETMIFQEDAKAYVEKHPEAGVFVSPVYRADDRSFPEVEAAYKVSGEGLTILEEKIVWDENGTNTAGGKGCFASVFDRNLFFLLFL
jgi:hypothetical protein